MNVALSSGGAPLEDNAPHILVVDDDARIRDLLSRYLRSVGYRVSAAENAAAADRHLHGLAFDLVILDVSMPGETGIAFAARLRRWSSIPILMLTARGDPKDRIQGLEVGVDDYLPKPFEPRELALRIAAILRRLEARNPTALEDIRFGPYVFDQKRQELTRAGITIRLTEREKQILRLFAQRPGGTVPRVMIVGGAAQVSERTADVQINRLRRKIEEDPADPRYLLTVRGVGYKLLCE